MTDILKSDFSEPGFLKRLRNWRDAMPWLALADCLGPASSLVALGLSMIALFVGSLGAFLLEYPFWDTPEFSVPSAALYPPHLETSPLNANVDVRTPVFVAVHQQVTSPVMHLTHTNNTFAVSIIRLLQQIWLFAVWSIPAGYVMRHSVLAVAGRERMATVETIKFVGSRWLSFLSGPALTLGFAAVLSNYFVLLGLIDHIPYLGAAATFVGSIAGVPIALLIGVLILGTLLSFPLMWASIVSESYSDGFDSASRGFEYIVQRPFRFVIYVCFAIALSLVAHLFVQTLTMLGHSIVTWAFTSVSPREALPATASIVLTTIPIAFAFNLFWAFSGAIYLLLRRDTNHQEIEDVWEPDQPPATPLPGFEKPEASTDEAPRKQEPSNSENSASSDASAEDSSAEA